MISSPVPLTESHDTSQFYSGEPTLDDWLRQRALRNASRLASKTFVICPEGSKEVIGYYALSMGQILNSEVIGSMRRNMPNMLPAIMLGRLAISEDHQGKGLGQSLLFDVVQRSLRTATSDISARLILVHAISPEAEQFYLKNGFTRLPVETPTFALDLLKIKNITP